MLKTVSVSDLRAHIKRILNEVGYGQTEYLVQKFGEPTAAIISIQDYELLQEIKKKSDTGVLPTSFVQKLQIIHQELHKSGYRPRTKEEVDAQIQAERESWGA